MGFKKGHVLFKINDKCKKCKQYISLNKLHICKDVWNKNVPCSEEHKIKISLSNKGRIAWNKGLLGYRKGIKQTDKHRQNLSNSIKLVWQNPGYREKLSSILRGRIFSEEHRRKLSLANKIKESNFKGKKHTEEAKRKIKEKRKLQVFSKERNEKISIFLTVKTNPSWIDGRSYLPYAPEFNRKLKEKIKQRDNYTCKKCFKTRKELPYLTVHHIDYNKKNSNIDNLITLCSSCNSIANKNREKWKEYFTKHLTTILESG